MTMALLLLIAVLSVRQSTSAASNHTTQDEKWSFNHHPSLSTPFFMGENVIHTLLFQRYIFI
jgi:hypothetical protein